MGVKMGSLVLILVISFLAKISFESAVAEKIPEQENLRSPASIDKSYQEHLNRY
jgi:hypothetical protein